MRWSKILWPRRLKPKFVLLLAVVGIALIFVLVLQLRVLRAVSEVHLGKFPYLHGRMFRAGGVEDEEEDDIGFMHLERKWKEPEWEVAEILRQRPTMKEPVVPVIIVEEHFEGQSHFSI